MSEQADTMHSKETESYVRAKYLLMMQVLTEDTFREELKTAMETDKQKKGSGYLETVNLLKCNGYSESLARELHDKGFSVKELENSKTTEILPDAVELSTIGATNFNW